MPFKDIEKQRLAQQESYRRNIDSVLARAQQQKRELRAWMDNLKTGKPCLDCKVVYPPYVMDYHHREAVNKYKNVSWLLFNKGKSIVLEEISKCDLICANCHRIREHS